MTDLIWQLFSIGCVAAAFLFFWDQLCLMEHSFYRIVVRFLAYKDVRPMKWLIINFEYIGFAMLLVGHFFSLIALLQQLSNGEIHNKSHFFYASSPLNNIGLIVAFSYILKKLYRRAFSFKSPA